MSEPMSKPIADTLTDIWYFICPSSDVAKGKMARHIICDQPINLGRNVKGEVFAMRDVCPHRAAPLSNGRLVEEGGKSCVECPYHGWRMNQDDGVCAKLPALSDTRRFPVEKVRVPIYLLHEEHGLIWIYIPDDIKRFDGVPKTPPPVIPHAAGGLSRKGGPRMRITVPAIGPYDEAVIGLVDPAHTPYVHEQWFWRNSADAQEKIKEYEPCRDENGKDYAGFVMKAHPPASNGRAYKLIGGDLTTEIEFRLPGTRLETIRNEKYTILGLTCITPLEKGQSSITQMFFWDMPLLSIVRPLIQPLATTFLGQDGAILSGQSANINFFAARGEKINMLYADHPDELAKWYLALKKSWNASQETGDDFENPIQPAKLYWKT